MQEREGERCLDCDEDGQDLQGFLYTERAPDIACY